MSVAARTSRLARTAARGTVAFVLLAFVAGCNPAPSPPASQVPMQNKSVDQSTSAQASSRQADRLAAMEAVFRHQFDHNESGAQRDVEYVFLSFGGLGDLADPPPEVLDRFAGEKPIVLPVSKAVRAVEGVKHKELGGSGLIFYVASIAWLDANTAEVEGGYYRGGRTASGNTYRVERTAGAWKVTSDQFNWVS